MKTNRYHNRSHNQGSVLVVSLTVLAVAAIVLTSYLVLVQTQTNSVARSQTWNSAMAITEAGIEEGLAEINRGSPVMSTNSSSSGVNAWNFTNNIAMDGWSQFVNGKSTITRYVSGSNAGSNYYTVMIDISSGTPTITSAGTVAFTPALWGSYGVPQPFLAQVGANTAANIIIGRRVQVQTVIVPLFAVGILTRSNFNMNGNGTTLDSYDSSNTNYSTNGQWIASKRKAGGDLATDSAIIGDLSLGNGNIYGHVYTGPGSAQNAVQVGPNGAVGDLAWNAGSSGIETGYWAGNFNTAITDVSAPAAGTALPAAAPSGTYKGSIVLSGGNYTAPTDPGKPLVITGATTLWVQGSFSPAGIIITNGGSLALYIGAASGSGNSLSLSGNGTINQPGLAVNLQIYGLPSLTSISLSGNAGFIGSVYAPEADFSGGGGGNNALDSSGALIVNSVTLNGHWNFHYDENLKVVGPSRGWIAKNWTEIKY